MAWSIQPERLCLRLPVLRRFGVLWRRFAVASNGLRGVGNRFAAVCSRIDEVGSTNAICHMDLVAILPPERQFGRLPESIVSMAGSVDYTIRLRELPISVGDFCMAEGKGIVPV